MYLVLEWMYVECVVRDKGGRHKCKSTGKECINEWMFFLSLKGW